MLLGGLTPSPAFGPPVPSAANKVFSLQLRGSQPWHYCHFGSEGQVALLRGLSCAWQDTYLAASLLSTYSTLAACLAPAVPAEKNVPSRCRREPRGADSRLPENHCPQGVPTAPNVLNTGRAGMGAQVCAGLAHAGLCRAIQNQSIWELSSGQGKRKPPSPSLLPPNSTVNEKAFWKQAGTE